MRISDWSSYVSSADLCSPRIDTRGNLPDPDIVSELQPGLHDRDQVAQILGSPSTVGTFDDSTWYYISKRPETVAFFETETVDQQVLEIGRASGRDRVCKSVYISMGAEALNKKN